MSQPYVKLRRFRGAMIFVGGGVRVSGVCVDLETDYFIICAKISNSADNGPLYTIRCRQ